MGVPVLGKLIAIGPFRPGQGKGLALNRHHLWYISQAHRLDHIREGQFRHTVLVQTVCR